MRAQTIRQTEAALARAEQLHAEAALEARKLSEPLHFADSGKTSFLYFKAEGLLTMVIWADFEITSAEGGERGRLVRGAPPHVLDALMRSADGRIVACQCRTRDGKTGRVIINNVSYDLAGGRLFLVSTRGGGTRVRQLQRDLDKVQATDRGVERLAKTDPEVARYVAAVK
jgi:hypothetical protein